MHFGGPEAFKIIAKFGVHCLDPSCRYWTVPFGTRVARYSTSRGNRPQQTSAKSRSLPTCDIGHS